jgi:8-oxo-dGTP diphosphatase
MFPQHTLRVVAYAVVENQRLLIVRKRHTTKFMFPGGKFAPGEQDLDEIAREVQEELNCQVDWASVEFLGEFETAAANEPNTRLIARVYQGGLLGTPVASNEIAEIHWLDYCNQANGLPLAPLLEDCILPRLQGMVGP